MFPSLPLSVSILCQSRLFTPLRIAERARAMQTGKYPSSVNRGYSLHPQAMNAYTCRPFVYPSSVNRGYSLHQVLAEWGTRVVLGIHPLSIEAIHSTYLPFADSVEWLFVSILCQSRLFTPLGDSCGLGTSCGNSIHPLSIEAIHSTKMDFGWVRQRYSVSILCQSRLFTPLRNDSID